jgi:hypothetical protein
MAIRVGMEHLADRTLYIAHLYAYTVYIVSGLYIRQLRSEALENGRRWTRSL